MLVHPHFSWSPQRNWLTRLDDGIAKVDEVGEYGSCCHSIGVSDLDVNGVRLYLRITGASSANGPASNSG